MNNISYGYPKHFSTHARAVFLQVVACGLAFEVKIDQAQWHCPLPIKKDALSLKLFFFKQTAVVYCHIPECSLRADL